MQKTKLALLAGVGLRGNDSERHLIPVVEAMLHQFPFRILGFHRDNGAEYLNRRLAALPNKLLVEFTRSRAYRARDNAPPGCRATR